MLLDKDVKIIDVLKQDARLSIRDIAKKTSLRPSTVHDRISKLKKDNVIEKFTVKLNNQAVGENFIVFLFVTTSRDLDSTFFNNKHIKEVFGITGEYDLVLKLKFKDIEEFNKFIISLRKNTAIKKTQTMIATIGIKEEI
jgi:DNA-binding Lrp family transcriptional regulator